ncbi:AcrR family transcriptional regulator [Xanthomonas sp. 60]
MPTPTAPSDPRRRMPREARTRQLLDVAWQLIGSEGTDQLTLARLAEAAGVTKPVAYDHFGTRNGLLAALYEDYDVRQTRLFDAAVDAARATLQEKAQVVASSYVECVLTQGQEISAVVAALGGSAELLEVKRTYQHAFIQKCRDIFAPFAGPRGLATASLWAMLGAADTLSQAALDGDIGRVEASDELLQIILGLVARTH